MSMARRNTARPESPNSFWRRAVVKPTAAVTVMSAMSLSLIALTPTLATADPATTPAPVNITATGSFPGGTVPDGVCAVQAEVLGGAGGRGIGVANANGAGADVSATFPVVPGMAYGGSVGGGGSAGALSNGAAGIGGANGGGTGGFTSPPLAGSGITHHGAGGGGWSEFTLGGLPAIVAGGGGGSAGGHANNGGFGGNAGLPGGTGVTAGNNGVNGFDPNAAGDPTPGGGEAGGTAGPGAGGAHSSTPARNGFAGSGRDGGAGGNDANPDAGGGGGAGYTGAGGGASTGWYFDGEGAAGGTSGGGGGGGSSYVAPNVPVGVGAVPTGISSTVGAKLPGTGTGTGADGSVKLTWVTCDYDLEVTKSVSPENAPIGSTVTWTVAVKNIGTSAMTRGDTVTIADDLPGAGPKTITDLTTSGGSNSVLSRGTVTCDAAVGDAMPGTLTCSRAYSAPTAGGAPSGGVRGIDVGETLTIEYEQVVPGANGTTTTNTASVTDRESGDTNDSASATVTAVSNPPVAHPDETSGPQGIPQSIDPLTNDEVGSVPLDPTTLTLLNSAGDEVGSVTIPNQGEYTIVDGKIVFTPEPDFVGEATPADYRIADENDVTTTSTYTPTFTAVVPTADPDVTSGPQGIPQSIDPLVNDDAGDPLVPLDPTTLTLLNSAGDEVGSVTIPNQGEYTIVDGKIVFTPEPDFVGEATPVDYRISDENGTTTESTYTPTLTPVTPAANPDVTEGPQGAPQSIDPFTNDVPGSIQVPLDPGSLTLLNSAGDEVGSVTIPNQGTYEVVGGKIVFTPLPKFVGEATPVDYRISDQNGTTAESTYTPTVTPVAQPDTTSGPQGIPQSVEPWANDDLDSDVELDPTTLTLLNSAGDVVNSVTVPNEGTYEVVGGKIVFTPEPDFVGTATPVIYRVDSTVGDTVESTYTPTTTPVNPAANPDTSSGKQGLPQSVDPFVNDVPGSIQVPLDPTSLKLLNPAGDEVGSVTIPNQGEYTIVDGKIVFTPEPGFVGEATPVDYRISDENGTTTESTYTPTVTAVTPQADTDQSSGPLNTPQSVDPMANDAAGDPGVPLDPDSLTLFNSAGVAVDEVEVDEGTYRIVDGRIVFTPVFGFFGTATPVDYGIADANGTTAESTYTPTIVAGPAEDVGKVTETGPVGSVVHVDPADDVPGLVPSSVRLLDENGDRVRTLVVPGEGTWDVDPVTGIVTFTPESGFKDDPTPVDFAGHKLDGTPVTGTLYVEYYEEKEPYVGLLPDTGAGGMLLPLGGLGLLLVAAGAFLIRRRRGVPLA